MTTYTVDPTSDNELVLVQFDLHSAGGIRFRNRLLVALEHEQERLNIINAYYYDDAIWIHSGGTFSQEQIRAIDALAAQSGEDGGDA